MKRIKYYPKSINYKRDIQEITKVEIADNTKKNLVYKIKCKKHNITRVPKKQLVQCK